MTGWKESQRVPSEWYRKSWDVFRHESVFQLRDRKPRFCTDIESLKVKGKERLKTQNQNIKRRGVSLCSGWFRGCHWCFAIQTWYNLDVEVSSAQAWNSLCRAPKLVRHMLLTSFSSFTSLLFSLSQYVCLNRNLPSVCISRSWTTNCGNVAFTSLLGAIIS